MRPRYRDPRPPAYNRLVTFPWLDRTRTASDGAARRLAASQRELRERSALLARLGLSEADCAARLAARVAWEFEPSSTHGGHHARPAGLGDQDIAALVREVYASKRY